MMDSSGYLVNSKEYINYSRFVEAHLPMNTIKRCEGDFFGEFLKYKFIHMNLEDIHKKCNLNDYKPVLLPGKNL